eukprot:scaffold31062_cov22-Prasinocladus_malaysianus.AAC.1
MTNETSLCHFNDDKWNICLKYEQTDNKWINQCSPCRTFEPASDDSTPTQLWHQLPPIHSLVYLINREAGVLSAEHSERPVRQQDADFVAGEGPPLSVGQTLRDRKPIGIGV